MVFSVLLFIFVGVFVLQLILCLKAKNLLIKLIPGLIILAAELVCIAAYAVSMYQEKIGEGIYGAAFAAVIYAIVNLILLAGDLVAWAISGLVNYVQKKRK